MTALHRIHLQSFWKQHALESHAGKSSDYLVHTVLAAREEDTIAWVTNAALATTIHMQIIHHFHRHVSSVKYSSSLRWGHVPPKSYENIASHRRLVFGKGSLNSFVI